MQNAARYREFAETLETIAEEALEPTREVILSAAMTWRSLADEAEARESGPVDGGSVNVVDLANARRRMRG